MTTDNGYDSSQILKMERSIAMELEWKLTPPTVESWIKICLTKWDEYCNQDCFDSFSGSMLFHDVFSIIKENFVSNTGKLRCEMHDLYTLYHLDSCTHYREFTQIIDIIMLDIDSILFKPQALILATIFCVVAMECRLILPRELFRYRFKQNLIRRVLSQNIHHYTDYFNKTIKNGQQNVNIVEFQDSNLSLMNDESEELIISQQNLTIRNLDDFVAFFFCFKEYICNNSNTMDDNKCDFRDRSLREDFRQESDNYFVFNITYDEICNALEFVSIYAGELKFFSEMNKKYMPGAFNPATIHCIHEQKMTAVIPANQRNKINKKLYL